jgi:hypothetical protein
MNASTLMQIRACQSAQAASILSMSRVVIVTTSRSSGRFRRGRFVVARVLRYLLLVRHVTIGNNKLGRSRPVAKDQSFR